MKETIDELMDLLKQYDDLCQPKASLQQFESDFFGSSEPLTELLFRIGPGDWIRLENQDFCDKEYMLVN